MKMDPSDEISRSMIKWLQTLIPHKTRSVSEISDGVAIIQVLVQIAPEYFGKLEPKIKTDVNSNWRLKVSNLKKINEGIIEFYQDFLNMQVLDIGKPDVVKLGETNDLVQLGKLLRLVLGCAIHCDKKQDYITQIMSLEESVQQSIMQAIQQLEEVTGGSGRSGLSLISLDTDSRVLRLVSDLEAANEAKEALTQQCHNLEMQVQSLMDEKQLLTTENNQLSAQIKEKEIFMVSRSPDNRRQIDLLKEEIFKLESLRDDYNSKIVEQEKQIINLQEKVSDLQLAADATSRLKDEVDVLSESVEKVQLLENTLVSYKKKLEEYGDMKKQMKVLEEKNMEYLQKNLKYEEEHKKITMWKNQCELYKKQIVDLQQKLDEETQKADRVSFLYKNVETKLKALQCEKERILQERDALREENEEFKLGNPKQEGGAVMAQELAPTEMKERLRHLETENRTLRTCNQDAEAKIMHLDNALNRLEKLTEQNRNANQKIIELETQLEEHTKSHPLETTIKEHKQKISLLQESLASKENELQEMQNKYARNVEKAKDVVRVFDPKRNGSMEMSLRQNMMKEQEEKLVVSALYHLSLATHRENVDERLAVLSAGQGQSFLQRQRQPTPRKPLTPFKSK